MDYFAAFDQNGHIQVIREDTDKNGKIDYIRYFRNSEQYRTERDTDHDGFFESVSFIKNHLIVKTKIDKNKDGRPDIIIFFDRNRKKKKLEWDSDFDGYFETTQIYDDPEWTMIVCQDTNADNITDIRSFYKDQVLMRRELDDNSDGKIDGIEFYGKTGVLRKIKEIKKGRAAITWFYDTSGHLIRGEEDTNLDGLVDTWYLYNKGTLTGVREDTNHDGRADLWEKYDNTQALIKREKDLDFDGIPDFTDQIDKTQKS